jgi:hypothetical protein
MKEIQFQSCISTAMPNGLKSEALNITCNSLEKKIPLYFLFFSDVGWDRRYADIFNNLQGT